MFSIAVINSKGGTGKSTISTNLASYYQSKGFRTALIDFDRQASSSFWYQQRDRSKKENIQLIQGFDIKSNLTRDYQVTPDAGTEYCVMDFPSNIVLSDYHFLMESIDALLIPMLSSSIDIHATTKFIHLLLLQSKFNRYLKPIGVVTNKLEAKQNLMHFKAFLKTLKISYISSLQSELIYNECFRQGKGIFDNCIENKISANQSWQSIIEWVIQSEQLKTRINKSKYNIP